MWTEIYENKYKILDSSMNSKEKIGLPGTRTQNYSVKSRVLYH